MDLLDFLSYLAQGDQSIQLVPFKQTDKLGFLAVSEEGSEKMSGIG